MEWLVILLFAGLIAYLWFTGMLKTASDTVSSMKDLWKIFAETNGDKPTAIINAIEQSSKEHGIPGDVILAFCYAESDLKQYATGDATTDIFGVNRPSSFGYMQINTSKQSKSEWSTFDMACEYNRIHEIIRTNNLHSQDVRDSEVLKASKGDKSSKLFDPLVNVFCGAWYLKHIKETKQISLNTIEDVLKMAYHYNVGLNPVISFDAWKNMRKTYINKIKSVLSFCGWKE